MKNPCKRVQDIANALAFGSTKLDESGLVRYLASVEADLHNDLKYGRSGRKNAQYLQAAKLAICLTSSASDRGDKINV